MYTYTIRSIGTIVYQIKKSSHLNTINIYVDNICMFFFVYHMKCYFKTKVQL